MQKFISWQYKMVEDNAKINGFSGNRKLQKNRFKC